MRRSGGRVGLFKPEMYRRFFWFRQRWGISKFKVDHDLWLGLRTEAEVGLRVKRGMRPRSVPGLGRELVQSSGSLTFAIQVQRQ